MKTKMKEKKSIELEICEAEEIYTDERYRWNCPICKEIISYSGGPQCLKLKGKTKDPVCPECAEEHNYDLYSKIIVSNILFGVKEKADKMKSTDADCPKLLRDLRFLRNDLDSHITRISGIIEKKALINAQKLADTGIPFDKITIDGIKIWANNDGVTFVDYELPSWEVR